MQVSKHTLVETDNYTLECELNLDVVLLHLEYTGEKFTKTIYKDMLEDWIDILDTLASKGVGEIMAFIKKDDKICKWQEMFGLSPLLEFEDSVLYRRFI